MHVQGGSGVVVVTAIVIAATAAGGLGGGFVVGLQGIFDDDEEGAQELAAGPADGAADLGAQRVGYLDQILERDGDEAEAGGAEEAEDQVGPDQRAAFGGPDEEEVAEADQGHGGLDVGQVAFVAVDQRRRQGRGDEADEDQEGAGDPGLGFGVVVRVENLVEQGGEGVEEGDVGPEREDDEKVRG